MSLLNIGMNRQRTRNKESNWYTGGNSQSLIRRIKKHREGYRWPSMCTTINCVDWRSSLGMWSHTSETSNIVSSSEGRKSPTTGGRRRTGPLIDKGICFGDDVRTSSPGVYCDTPGKNLTVLFLVYKRTPKFKYKDGIGSRVITPVLIPRMCVQSKFLRCT